MNIQENKVMFVPFTGDLKKIHTHVIRNVEKKIILKDLRSYISSYKINENDEYEFKIIDHYTWKSSVVKVTKSEIDHLLEEITHDKLKKNFDFANTQKEEEKILANRGHLNKFFKLKNINDLKNWWVGQDIKSESKNLGKLEVGVASCQGRQDKMEDAELATEISFTVDGNTYTAQLLGVFDGHDGNLTSNYVKENLSAYLTASLEKNNEKQLTENGIWNALKECFINLDRDYSERGGTTATVALILEDKVWVANVGDSRTILCNGDQAIQLSEDAKPDMDRYERSILKLGGTVVNNRGARINGMLGVARAVGDKHIIGKKGMCCVSPKPKITQHSLEGLQNGYLVLACDGLYDVATTGQVANAVKQMDQERVNPEEMARRLVYSAIESGSRDNVTAKVIKIAH